MSPLLASLGRSLGRLMIAITVIIGLSVASPANADNWDAESLTIKSNPEGALVTFSEKDVKAGRKSFNQAAAHAIQAASPKPITTLDSTPRPFP